MSLNPNSKSQIQPQSCLPPESSLLIMTSLLPETQGKQVDRKIRLSLIPRPPQRIPFIPGDQPEALQRPNLGVHLALQKLKDTLIPEKKKLVLQRVLPGHLVLSIYNRHGLQESSKLKSDFREIRLVTITQRVKMDPY